MDPEIISGGGGGGGGVAGERVLGSDQGGYEKALPFQNPYHGKLRVGPDQQSPLWIRACKWRRLIS